MNIINIYMKMINIYMNMNMNIINICIVCCSYININNMNIDIHN